MSFKKITLLLLGCVCSASLLRAEPQAVLKNSVKPLSRHVLRAAPLRPEHLGKELEFQVALQMRDFPKMLARVAAGETIQSDEMAARYLPLPADYEAVIDWAKQQHLTITQTDPLRLAVFVKGTISQIQTALRTQFAQVTVEEGTFLSAVTGPSIPARLSHAVLGVNGLQPQIHPRHLASPQAQTADSPPFLVKDIESAYGAGSLGYTGTGQTIAILIDTFPSNSDLTSFWNFNGIPQSLSNIQKIQVVSGALPAASGEETLDTEWSSGIASGADIRIYATTDLSFANLDKGLQRIISDLPAQPNLHQLSISLGLGETEVSESQLKTDAQYFAQLANGGVSVFVSSGDDGANPDGILQPSYFSSDPSVTGVGGTSIHLNSDGSISSETGWNGSGGGLSQFFSKPPWQAGQGVPSGIMRAVPDISAAADPNTGAYLFLRGSSQQIGGTSWSSPTWAGFCALINQARAQKGLGPIGLLNPKIYPLIGTSNFRDIKSGNNGNYSAAVGYDEVTGIGTPVMSALLPTLSNVAGSGPVVTSFSPTAGPANTSVAINGYGLARVTEVNFNGVAATAFQVNSDTSISAAVPAGATTGPISVVSGSTTGTSSENYNVVPLPTNGDFSDALSISGTSGTIAGTNEGATDAPAEGDIAGNPGGASVWYKWVAPAAGSYTFTTAGSNFDTLLAVCTGSSASALATVASNDDSGTSVTSSVTFTAASGSTYYIDVDGYDGTTGSIDLTWSENSAEPVINNFSPQSGSPGDTVTINGANLLGTQMVTFGQASAEFSVNSGGTRILAAVPKAATTGPITVSGPAGSVTSSANFVFIAPVSNDNFGNAAPIVGASGSATGNNSAATTQSGEPNPGDKSIWYAWTPSFSGPVNFNTFGSTFDTLLSVYTGTNVAALTTVASNANYGNTDNSSVTFLAQSGTTYEIAVDGVGGASGNVVLNWSKNNSLPFISGFSPTAGPPGTTIQISGSNLTGASAVALDGTSMNYTVVSDSEIDATVPAGASSGVLSVTNLLGTVNSASQFTVAAAPGNDSFASAVVLPGQSGVHVFGSNVGATTEPGEPPIAGNPGGASVWWSWTAPSTGVYAVSTLGSDFDTLLGVFSGTAVNNLTTIASNDDSPAGGQTSYLTFTATAGQTYPIAVDGFNGAAGAITLSIYPQQASTILFSTGFEAKEGYTVGQPLAGTSTGWLSDLSGGNGILAGQDGLTGQQAYVGLTAPTIAGDDGVFVWKPVGYQPTAQQPIVQFNVTMAINDSTNRHYDDFQWQLYNKEGHNFFTIDFANENLEVYYIQDGSSTYVDTGVQFTNNTVMRLQVKMDFLHNTWSATLNGETLVKSLPIRTASDPLDFGDMDAVWQIFNVNHPGDNYMMFDNYELVNSANPAPVITFAPQSQTVVQGNPVTFSVVAGGEPPFSYQWSLNGKAIPNATNATLTIPNVQAASAGFYTVTVSNGVGSVKSAAAKLVVTPEVAAPVFTVQPASLTVAQGSTIFLTGSATGSPSPQYQWSFDGTAISGATGTRLELTDVKPANGGMYVLKASNSIGMATSGTATLTVGSTFLAIRGNYNGMLHGATDPIGSGALKITTTAGRAFTGSLTLGGRVIAVAGLFNAEGEWQGTVAHDASGKPIVLYLQLALTGPPQIAGTVVDGANAYTTTAPRDNYSTAGTHAPQAGTYTMTLTGMGGNLPAGIGYAAMTVDTGGHVRATGRLGDNTPFTVSGVVSDAGAWPFYAALYGAKGFVGGSLTFSAAGGPVVGGTLNWLRPAATSGLGGYAGGFQGSIVAAGYPYAAPAIDTAALQISGQEKAMIAFSGPVLSGTLGGELGLNSAKSLVALTGSTPFTWHLTPSTGVFYGMVDAGFPAASPYYGVLIQPLNGGSGFFQSPTVSGQVQVTGP